jgi:hypothetical protein
MMTADEIARIRAEALEEVARLADKMAAAFNKMGEPHACGALEGLAEVIRTEMIPSPPLVDQGRQERVEDGLDEPQHRGPVHDAGRGVGEQPAAVDTDEARGGVLDVDLRHGWSPIETAPKDGTQVLVYGEAFGEVYGRFDENPIITVAEWSFASWLAVATDAYSVTIKPTHWAPLPKLPPSVS